MFSPTSPISALKRNSKKAVTLPLIAALSLAAVVACSSSEETAQQPSSSETSTNQQVKWLRTVSVDDHDVTVQSQPKRIVALSTEVADLALEPVGPERVVAVTKNALDESSGNQGELARQVPNAIANSTKPDPEQFLPYEPDMVQMTSRHDQEQLASELLGANDVSTAAFASSDFASPKTLVLFARGGQKMIMGMQSATTNLVELAGGEPISPKGKRPGAVPADPETIVQLNPDVILI